MFVCLLVQEVKHVLDGEGQGAPSVCCAEDGLKQVIHELLERTLSTNANADLDDALVVNLCLDVLAEHHLSTRGDHMTAERP